MYTAKIENRSGDVYILNGDEAVWQIASITGLNPPQGLINTTTIVGLDGAVFNSAKLETRNIVITVRITGNAEQNRLQLYRAFRTKEWCRFYYSNDSVDVWIDGYVESVECDLFQKAEQAQISIICPQPHLIGAEEIVKDISGITDMFSFPFAIEAAGVSFSDLSGADYAILHNSGDVVTGFVISVFARSTVTAPIIYNAVTNEAFRVKGTLEAGHTLTIDTRTGSHRLTITTPSGEVTNALHRKQKGGPWLQLQPGDNYIAYSAEAGAAAMLVTLRHNDLYVGV